MAIKKVRIEDAVGMVLGHDLTKIVPGEFKGPACKKGHIIREEDLPHLLSIGKDHIYLIELGPDQVHEDEAVQRIARAVAGEGVAITAPCEGRVNLLATTAGMLQINTAALHRINSIDDVAVATLHNFTLVKPGEMVAGVKIIPLVIGAEQLAAVEAAGSVPGGVVAVRQMLPLQVGLVITGNEVYYGRIRDRFAPVLHKKIADYGARLLDTVYQPDDPQLIAAAILELKRRDADIVVTSGGMSVDPDDVTSEAIRNTGARVMTYGAPVLPGAMMMLAYLDNTAIFGLPACGMYSRITVFDLLFPRLLAKIPVTKADIAVLGHGGLCRRCEACTYPQCPFGR